MKPITREWIDKAEADFATMERESRVRKNPSYDSVCFHAQQCAEKYLKARLSEAGLGFPRIHDLTVLLNLAVAVEPTWELSRVDLAYISDFAVAFRYPGESADRESALGARQRCRAFRSVARTAFQLPL